MKFHSVILAVGVLATTVAAQAGSEFSFYLRAWRDNRHPIAGIPQVDHRLELDHHTGNAIINRTAGYPGFESYISPTREEGTLHEKAHNLTGYLIPVHDGGNKDPYKHYQLRYSECVPKIKGVLYKNFTTVGRDCGGMCGGATLDYDTNSPHGHGEWYILPRKEKGPRKVWDVRWVDVKDKWATATYPEGSLSIFLWEF